MKKATFLSLLLFVAFQASAQTGIGVANPTEKLEVAGNIVIPAANAVRYATAKTKTLIVPGTQFMPENSGTSSKVAFLGGIYAGTGSPQAFLAPVMLPDSAVITSVDAYVMDNDASNTIALEFWRYNISAGATGTFTQIASLPGTVSSSATIQQLTTSAITNGTIDNTTYAYQLRIPFLAVSSNIRFYKAVITYTVNKME